ncbi:molybdate ABC transporter substrate-binding protein [Oleispirillum naphthae]|uniref:molybdate ABC transporter substrate-binding protein n=1 Tax=Oleispirillum naphthae TaxID=2838853 RepID=UPI0030823728
MMRKLRFAAALALALLPLPAQAGETLVAVAANFTAAAKEIGASFTAKTGHGVKFSFGSTGKLYTQISQGAPFEAFLAADDKRPAKAEKEGFGVPGSSFTYAVGKLVLWSKTPGLVDAKGAVLKTGKFNKVAIANPAAAPYGAAAVAAMQAMGVYDALKPKIVEGNNISQAHQFAATGAAELGFVAGSQVALTPEGSRWMVPDALYSPIYQDAVLLTKGAKNPAATAFLDYLRGPEAAEVLAKYGYGARK